jgi:hypothetical protein
MNSETKTCQNCKNDFTIESEDFIFYERMKVPAPTFCPECRAVRRLAFRNLRFLYRRKSDFSGEMIFSMYPENSDFPVYDSIEWWSDDWDALEFGQDYDFNKSFFKQFKDLAHAVPRPSRSIVNLENSDYSNNATDLKNCYLVFNANRCEDVVHGVGVNDTRNSVDCSYTNNCELCYDSIFLNRCTRAQYSAGCNDCLNVIFCKNCHGCTDCFGCINLRNKQYYIFNEPYSPEDYETKMREFNISNYDSVKEVKNKIKDFWLQHPVRYTESLKSSNFTGAYIYNSQDVYDSYYVQGGKDIKYCQYLTVPTNEHCYDYSLFGSNASFVYESVVIGHNANNIKFSAYCYLNVRDLEYCMFCHSSSDLFGCIGLRNKQYCIFNKQYTKEEYLALKDKIIQQMKGSPYTTTQGTVYAYGEFFPHEFAPVAYNTSSAFELFPKEKAQAHIKQRCGLIIYLKQLMKLITLF